ncbi:MAG: nucleotide exchange factor GrpE [Bacillota bacterium]
MWDEKKPEDEIEHEAASPKATPAEPAGEVAESATEDIDWQTRCQKAEERAEQNLNGWRRAQADFENYRRRAEAERRSFLAYANQELVLKLLPVLDNLERALATDRGSSGDGLRQGVELIARQFREVLAGAGVVPIEAMGKPFDPLYHEALMQAEDAEAEDDTVLQEFERGYMMGDRVIRPSKVKVSRRPE